MTKLTLATLLLTGALGLAAAQAQNKTLATVNGEAITEADIALAIEDLQAQYPNLPAERQKQVALDFLIEVKAAAQKAKAEKLEDSEDYKRKLAYARERILMERLLTREGEKAAGEAAVRAYYDEQVKQLKPVEEVRARHILVENEDEAKKVAARVKGGEDFAKIAGETSKDPGSGKEGGDLGFFTKDRMVPEFAEAAFALKPGEVSAPVKSQFGWHVIKLEERRNRPIPAYDQVKDRLKEALVGKAQSDFLARLRSEAKIETSDKK
ncbi:MAG: peptidylprolyl isomerase [Hyphomicrobiales bacterium]|uniref:peptidylprolyl isomerase n=1 Tax=Rhabdaerophilum calidifontis TaxID=2604328 RepID=UPI00123C13E4|nr:peptidylprolyl isomerase [Rhabdaerophilum calidifontis]MCA1951991.1 peptidylprolyl isomerase [Hyphomicrobiales bacterium]MCA1998796.1 peptidylprolyl isomerase [Hyphomicrobiales bacterium]